MPTPPGTLIPITASASCNGQTAEAVGYVVVGSPLQGSLHNPIRLQGGFDKLATGLYVRFYATGQWRVGSLLRDGRVLCGQMIYSPERW